MATFGQSIIQAPDGANGLAVTTTGYAAGDTLGSLLTFPVGTRSGILQGVQLTDPGNRKPTGSLYLFRKRPEASTLADNAGFVLAAADAADLLAVIPIAADDWVSVSNIGLLRLSGLGLTYVADGNDCLYVVMAVDGAFTWTQAVTLVVRLVVWQD